MIKIYTDGSCLENPGNGGWAAIINDDGNIKKISGFVLCVVVRWKYKNILGISLLGVIIRNISKFSVIFVLVWDVSTKILFVCWCEELLSEIFQNSPQF